MRRTAERPGPPGEAHGGRLDRPMRGCYNAAPCRPQGLWRDLATSGRPLGPSEPLWRLALDFTWKHMALGLSYARIY